MNINPLFSHIIIFELLPFAPATRKALPAYLKAPSNILSFPMEARPFSSTGLRLRMEEHLTCPVCLDLYTNPKTLPCLHSFCEACIERFPQDKEGETYYLSCPTCRHCTELPGGGAGAFPVAFYINNLKEMRTLMKNATIQPNTQQATMCKDHEKPLELFCETCDELICAHCTIDHKQHEYNLVTDSYTKHCQQLKEYLPPVKRKVETLKNVMFLLAEREKEIRERGEGVLEEIHEMVEEMMNVLRESERKLSEEAKRVTDAKLEVLSGQAKSAQISLSLLEHINDNVEQNVMTGTPQQVLRSKKQMMECMSEVTTQINVEELEPKEKADFVLSKDIKSLHHIGDIVTYSCTALQQCKVKKIGHLEHLPEEKKVSFSLSMEAPDSSFVSVPVLSLKCSLVPVGKGDEPIDTTVTTTSTHPGVYRIHCNPSTSGTHTVKVQVCNVELEDTSLVIPFNPYFDNITPVHTIAGLNRPWGVAVSDDGCVIATERNNGRVIILNKGNVVESVGFHSPRGVAITPDNHILVCDNHRIGKIRMDGSCIASVGEYGSGPLQFIEPDGIAISPITGQVYIADGGNHRIQVLNLDLTFSHSFGSQGSANGQFQYPCDIAIDSRGLVYVTDANNHRIQKFAPDGKFVAQFGNDLSDIRCPLGITIDRAHSLVYVTEYGKEIVPQSLFEKIHMYLSLYRTGNTSPVERLLVFTTDGRFLRCMSPFINPRGLTLDSNGLLYVCSNDVLIF